MCGDVGVGLLDQLLVRRGRVEAIQAGFRSHDAGMTERSNLIAQCVTRVCTDVADCALHIAVCQAA